MLIAFCEAYAAYALVSGLIYTASSGQEYLYLVFELCEGLDLPPLYVKS